MTEVERVPRVRLRAEVWAEPATVVAGRYGMTSTGLAKICSRLRIPVPPRGYWQKKEAGQRVAVVPLLEPSPGDEIEWSRDRWSRPRTQPFPAPEVPRRDGMAPGEPSRRVPAGHPLITMAAAIFEKAKVTEEGFLQPRAGGAADIYVSKESLPKALKLATELYRTLERRGFRVELGHPARSLHRPEIEIREEGKPRNDWNSSRRLWQPHRPTTAILGTVPISIAVFESTRATQVAWVDGKYLPLAQLPGRRPPIHSFEATRDLPTGRLHLQAASPFYRTSWSKRWSDAAGASLRSRLDEIAAEIEEAAPVIVSQYHELQQVLAREHEEAREAERKRLIIEAERRRLENLKAAREELEQIVQGWGHARLLEDFFQDLEARGGNLPPEERRSLRARLASARELLGGVDALAWFEEWTPPDAR
jgi:hypothetical protein